MPTRPDPAMETAGEGFGIRALAFGIDAVALSVGGALAWGLDVGLSAAAVGGANAGGLLSGSRSVAGTAALVGVWLVSWGAFAGIAVAYLGGTHALVGQTLGKRMVDLVVAAEDGGPCTARAAAVRSSVLLAPLPIAALLELLVGFVGGVVGVGLLAGWALVEFGVAVTDDAGRRLGDRVADTVVVREAIAAKRR